MNNQGDLTGKSCDNLWSLLITACRGFFEDADLFIWKIPDVRLCLVR